MRVGFVIQNQGEDALALVKTLAPEIEALGFHSVWLTDHVVGVRAFADHGYGPYWLEVLTSLAHVAAQTKRVRIGTSILILPLRDPVYAAKCLSTIDNLSDGRLVVGVGTGWSRGEFGALGRGAFHERRGEVTDESLDLILSCWRGGAIEWRGKYFEVRHAEFAPRPTQDPHPQLLIGGPANKAVAARIAKAKGGWHPAGRGEINQIREGAAKLGDLLGYAAPITYRLIVPPTTEKNDLSDRLHTLRELGCVEAVLDFRPTDRDGARRAAAQAAEILPAL